MKGTVRIAEGEVGGETCFRACLHGGRVPRLTGLPGYLARRVDTPLHATHPTGTVSGLRELSFERLLSSTNKLADQRNFFLFQFHVQALACSLAETHLLH